MGLFNRKKKAAEVIEVAIEATDVSNAGRVENFGNNAMGNELTAVISAAALAYDADSFADFAGVPSRMELAAVISAAVAAYEGGSTGFPYIGTGPSGLYVRKINRSAGFVSAWGTMGNREAIDARKF
jgi:hypothetical protein